MVLLNFFLFLVFDIGVFYNDLTGKIASFFLFHLVALRGMILTVECG